MMQSNIQENNSSVTPTVVQTDVGAKDGQNKCPRCGATDISLNTLNGFLRCSFCRHEFEPEKIKGLETNLEQLQGQVIGSGAQNIIADTKEIMTFKCSSCGAEVVIDTAESTQARCHWCRNTLSVNQQIPNGTIPDALLPFCVTKDIAKRQIEQFVGRRKYFAHPKFKSEFTTANVMGVYFPYMVVDVNSHAALSGQGEHLSRKYTRGTRENQKTYYDADLYTVEREFDLMIHGLTIESNSKRMVPSSDQTNNVINAIMPFDIENCVPYNANYLKGYTSEKRDTNVEQLHSLVNTQAKDIARISANQTLGYYDRGVAWAREQFDVKGEQWKAAYLPVWLYSYQEVKGEKKILHYVAVNGRTKETMGSVPLHLPKLFLVSGLVEVVGFLAFVMIDFKYNWLFLFAGLLYFFWIYARYRNSDARHNYETDTKTELKNLRKVDQLVKRRTGLNNARMEGANNLLVQGQKVNLVSLVNQNVATNFVKQIVEKEKL